MAKVNHITHKKSSVAGKAPNVGAILDGEIAVNYAKDTERMYIKNTSGEIIPFSSDHIIKDYVDKSNSIIIDGIIDTVDKIMAKGYDVSGPTLSNVYGSKESLNMVLKHYKMGLFKDGALVKECAPCRITKAVDGSDIKIDGSDGDIMLYTDTPIYRDRCRVTVVTVPSSTATTHNMIGLGLMPHKIGGKDAKKMNPFAFTPSYVQLDRGTNQYRSCYNTRYKGSGENGGTPQAMYKTNFIGATGAQGGYPVMYQSSADSMQRSRKKGLGYQGIFYEFYEMWLIAMYLELGSLLFTETDSFGAGCTYNTPNASNWISGGSSGIRIKDGKGEGTDDYSALMEYNYRIGAAVDGDTGKIRPIMGLVGTNYYNFEEALESQRFVDALVKSNLTDKVDGVTVLEYDDDVNKKGYVKVSSNVDLASGSGMTVDKKYYIIRNVPNCQGIGDGVMTYVLNVFVKTSFNANVYHGSVNVGNKEVIFKFSYPTYRGLELFSGAFTQIEGIHHIMGNYGGVLKGSIWYAKDYTDIKYDPTNFTNTDYSVSTSTPDENIPYIKGFVKAGEYDASNSGWVKNTNYDVSLYCATECGDRIASKSTYECGYVWRYGSSWGGVNVNPTNGYPNDGYKNVNASVVGCDASIDGLGRTLSAVDAVADGNDSYAGGFALGNPSLYPAHRSDSGSDDGTIRV